MKSLFNKHPELLTIPAAVLVWIASIFILRWLDPAAGTFDAGIFQIPLFSIIQFLLFVAVSWLVFGLVFGTLKRYLTTDMKSDFKQLTPWQKLKLAYSLFFSLLAVLAYLARTLVTG